MPDFETQVPDTHAGATLIAMVVLAVVTIIGVVGVALGNPPQAVIIITAIIGSTTPIELGLLGWLQHSSTIHMNSRLTQLMRVQQAAKLAEGRLQGTAAAGGAASDVPTPTAGTPSAPAVP